MTHVAGHLASSPLSNKEYDDAVGGGGGATDDRRTQLRDLPDGRTVLIDMNTGDEIRTVATAAPKAGDQPRNLGAGVFEDDSGYYVKEFAPGGPGGLAETKRYLTKSEAEARLKGPASGGGGGSGLTYQQQLNLKNTPSRSISQSLSDPAALQIQRDQLAQSAEQNELDRAAEAQAQKNLIAQQQRTLEETIRSNRVAAAQQDQNLDFLYNKFTVETEANNQTAIRDTQQMIWNAQRDKADIDYKYAGLQQEAAAFNAQQQFAVDVENQRRTEAQAERKRALAESIGTTAQDAGSRGKLAAQLLANPGLGELDTALAGGEDFFTQESLVPLTDLLGQRADAAKDPNFLSFNPITAPTMPQLTMPNFQQQPPTAPPVVPGAGGSPGASQGLAGLTKQQLDAGVGNQQISGPQDNAADLATQLQKALTAAGYKDGGVARGMYMGDEDGAELHLPLAPGEAFVVKHDQVHNFLKAVAGMKGNDAPAAADMSGMGIGGMAEGGLFDQGTIFGNAQINDQSGTRSFLAEALKRALSGTPWQQQGTAPTPVEVSAPGTDQIVQQLGGSLSALGTGVPADLFLRRARALTPVGISERAGGLRRTS